MCGISAAVGWSDAEARVARMTQGIAHRGEVTDPIVSPWPGAAVCTRRLRIVDAERGRQPMLSADGRVLLSFNGEIYNHKELRRELEGLGVVFRTHSDTEVLACALSVWGAAAISRLVGMYAFVALDLRTRDFVAARDPLGVKPLYLIQEGDRFLFCSEIAPLLDASDVGDVLLLPPGHLLTRSVCLPFPTVFTQFAPPAAALVGELDAVLAAAVHSRVPEDLPFALMFSGGIDSTLVAHYARQLRPEAPGYFLGDERAPDYRFAAAYADASGMELRTVPLPPESEDPDMMIDAIVEAVETFEPGTVRQGLCSYVLSRAMHADRFKVALCGDGADELFAGYRTHELGYAAGEDVGAMIRNQGLALMARDNLQLLDRCSMRFQVEAREPFLDTAVVALALRSPGSALLTRGKGGVRGKAPLRALFDRHPEALPAAIRDRRKTPFNEGSGFDVDAKTSPWTRHADRMITQADLEDGMREFAPYAITTKEELLYIRKLSARMNIARVPHLSARMYLAVPDFEGHEVLRRHSISHVVAR